MDLDILFSKLGIGITHFDKFKDLDFWLYKFRDRDETHTTNPRTDSVFYS